MKNKTKKEKTFSYNNSTLLALSALGVALSLYACYQANQNAKAIKNINNKTILLPGALITKEDVDNLIQDIKPLFSSQGRKDGDNILAILEARLVLESWDTQNFVKAATVIADHLGKYTVSVEEALDELVDQGIYQHDYGIVRVGDSYFDGLVNYSLDDIEKILQSLSLTPDDVLGENNNLSKELIRLALFLTALVTSLS